MIDAGQVRLMAGYNRWQNRNLYEVAGGLPDAERRRERGAFFGSIHATLNHLLWADRIWLSLFAGTPSPEGGVAQSVSLHEDWDHLARHREAFDQTLR